MYLGQRRRAFRSGSRRCSLRSLPRTGWPRSRSGADARRAFRHASRRRLPSPERCDSTVLRVPAVRRRRPGRRLRVCIALMRHLLSCDGSHTMDADVPPLNYAREDGHRIARDRDIGHVFRSFPPATVGPMILSDRSIREELATGRIVIDPLDESCVQPSSVDLHVDRYFRVFRNHTMGYIDVKQDQEELTELVEIKEDDVFILHPGEFVLGSTLERVALPDDLVARLEGKSSLGRLGLLIHSTAGFVDAGWDGHLTLELSNVANLPIALYPGMKIGQISFLRMTTPADQPYGSTGMGSKYQGQRGPTPSRYFENVRGDR